MTKPISYSDETGYGVNIKWEVTSVRRDKGMTRLLEEGWEPFAVVQHDGIDFFYLRRKIE